VKIAEKMACGSALFLGLWHLGDFALRALVYGNRWQRCTDLIFGLTLGLLQEVPERVNKDVVYGRALVLLGAANLPYPVYGSPVLGSKANGGPVSIVRDVLLSRAHCSTVCWLHLHIVTFLRYSAIT